LVSHWRLWSCRFGENRLKEAEEDIRTLNRIGFKAKIWAPLPQHKKSGHIHVVVLCNQEQLSELMELFERLQKDPSEEMMPIQTIRRG
jgi:hypothetical protein